MKWHGAGYRRADRDAAAGAPHQRHARGLGGVGAVMLREQGVRGHIPPARLAVGELLLWSPFAADQTEGLPAQRPGPPAVALDETVYVPSVL